MMNKKSKGIYDVLKGRFLTDESSFKNWRIIIFVVGLLLVMVWSAHSIDEKVTKVSELHKKKRELREVYIDTKKTLALMKLESSIRKKVGKMGLVSAKTPPQKIKVTVNN